MATKLFLKQMDKKINQALATNVFNTDKPGALFFKHSFADPDQRPHYVKSIRFYTVCLYVFIKC